MSYEPELSVVVPLYNEQENIAELHRRLDQSLRQLDLEYEMIFVDDGSRDLTPVMLDELVATNPRLTVLQLSRNFGHQPAICAGIDAARGKAVILMDGDLQDPPEVLGQFVAAWRAGGEVVYAVRTQRKESLPKRFAYALFYRLLRATSDIDIPLDSGDFCLMDRKVVEALRDLPERQRFVRGLRSFVGFRQVGLEYERNARHAGEPKYTFSALVRLALDGLLGFSSYPLRLLGYLGASSVVAVLVVAGWVALGGFDSAPLPPAWAAAVLITLLLASMQLVGMGILAEYVRRIFVETKGRPTYVVGAVKEQRHAGDIRRQPAIVHGTARVARL